MQDIVSRYPITTLAGKELLAAGEVCSPSNLQAIVKAASNTVQHVKLMMGYNTISKDLIDLLTTPPYSVIFAERQVREDVLDVIHKVTVPEPMLEALDYFKEYDAHTYLHMLAIYALSILLAWELDSSGIDRIQEVLAGPSHDLGKINVPIEILTKTESLVRAEQDHLKHHALAGYVHLACHFKDSSSYAARLARDHHERLDGSGYPGAIRQRDPFVEVIAIADIYDALISPRPYRPQSYDNRTAIEEITRLAEAGKINWDTVKTLVVYNRKDKPHGRPFHVSLEKRGMPPTENRYGTIADP